METLDTIVDIALRVDFRGGAYDIRKRNVGSALDYLLRQSKEPFDLLDQMEGLGLITVKPERPESVSRLEYDCAHPYLLPTEFGLAVWLEWGQESRPPYPVQKAIQALGDQEIVRLIREQA